MKEMAIWILARLIVHIRHHPMSRQNLQEKQHPIRTSLRPIPAVNRATETSMIPDLVVNRVTETSMIPARIMTQDMTQDMTPISTPEATAGIVVGIGDQYGGIN